MRENLFSSWLNSALTLLSVALVYAIVRSVIPWALTQANWRVVSANFTVLLWGRYPRAEAWRLGVSLLVVLAIAFLTWIIQRSRTPERWRRTLLMGWLLTPILITWLIRGFSFPTLATIGNNLGYYIFRPELLPLLGESWRANAALLIVAMLAGVTWGMDTARTMKVLAAIPVLIIVGLSLPLGLQVQSEFFGLPIPSLIPMALILGIGFITGRNGGRSLLNVSGIGRALPIAWVLSIPILIIILTSFDVGVERVAPAEVLTIVKPNIWSGILLTIVLSVVSIVASFPIGILLALGRRSTLPVVKAVCVLFIELVRGVPLITILFMAQVMLPLFLPLEITLDGVIRTMAGMTLFTAAYLAEIVRGGLQAVQHEQVEAARALGLSELLVTGLIVLPQALRAVIPPIMGQFVSIFKDTSLVTIVGLLDLLAVGQSVIKQREFLGAVREIYLFAGLFYFVISYAMSNASRRLERQLGVGER